MCGGAGRLRSATGDVNLAAHHVLGDARTGVSMHGDGGALIHASAVVADVAVDSDRMIAVGTRSDSMGAVRVGDGQLGQCRGGMEGRVEVAN